MCIKKGLQEINFVLLNGTKVMPGNKGILMFNRL